MPRHAGEDDRRADGRPDDEAGPDGQERDDEEEVAGVGCGEGDGEVAEPEHCQPAGDEHPGLQSREEPARDRPGKHEGEDDGHDGQHGQDRREALCELEEDRGLRQRSRLGEGDDDAGEERDGHRPNVDGRLLPSRQPASDQPEGDQCRDAGGQDHQPDGQVEATADGDERGGPGQQGIRPQDVADDAQARRIHRPIHLWQPAASQEEGDQGRRSGQDERGPRPDRLREEVHEGGGDPDAATVGGIGEADGGRTRDTVVGDRHPGQGDRHREADASPRQHPSDREERPPFTQHRHGLADGQEAESDQEDASTPTQVADDAADEEPGRLGDDGQQIDRLDLRTRPEGGLDGR